MREFGETSVMSCAAMLCSFDASMVWPEIQGR